LRSVSVRDNGRISRPASRLLAFLELLQNRPGLDGRAAASELGVSERTIRRYAVSLHELGMPVDGQPGVGGGYRLRPGTRLPPLMLTDAEAAAAAYGLMLAEQRGLDGAAGASTKLARVLPRHVAAGVERLRTETSLAGEPEPPAVSGELLLRIAEAVRRRRALAIGYVRRDGVESRRTIDPFGLVARRGRWYVPARDHRSGEVRTFRADRIASAAIGEPAAPADPGFDAEAHVTAMLATVPARWQVEVLVHAPLAAIEPWAPPTLAALAAEGAWTRLRMGVDSLDWAAGFLARLGADLRVVAPEELRAALAELGTRLLAAAAS
jgi:predicted DNA-binding transcriptional regulator YafY